MRFLIIIALALLVAGGAHAQANPYTLEGAVAPGGAVTLAGGAYTLAARLTQPGQAPSAGGNYSVGEGPPMPATPRAERLYLPLLRR